MVIPFSANQRTFFNDIGALGVRAIRPEAPQGQLRIVSVRRRPIAARVLVATVKQAALSAHILHDKRSLVVEGKCLHFGLDARSINRLDLPQWDTTISTTSKNADTIRTSFDVVGSL